MCILFIAKNRHPDYPLIVAANRDEFYERPSKAMHYWMDQPTILAGRDLVSGGSWLGLNTGGRFCAVTNLRQIDVQEERKSRGKLVSRYLKHSESNQDFAEFLGRQHHSFNPFNLVFGSIEELYLFSSHDHQLRPVQDGFHSISNGPVMQPWPKMSRGVANLQNLVNESVEIDFEKLTEIMIDQNSAPDELLPNTGLDQAREKQLSSIFVSGQDYGTRSTTLILFSKRNVTVRELTYRKGGLENPTSQEFEIHSN